jgi:hypothetical protein
MEFIGMFNAHFMVPNSPCGVAVLDVCERFQPDEVAHTHGLCDHGRLQQSSKKTRAAISPAMPPAAAKSVNAWSRKRARESAAAMSMMGGRSVYNDHQLSWSGSSSIRLAFGSSLIRSLTCFRTKPQDGPPTMACADFPAGYAVEKISPRRTASTNVVVSWSYSLGCAEDLLKPLFIVRRGFGRLPCPWRVS